MARPWRSTCRPTVWSTRHQCELPVADVAFSRCPDSLCPRGPGWAVVRCDFCVPQLPELDTLSLRLGCLEEGEEGEAGLLPLSSITTWDAPVPVVPADVAAELRIWPDAMEDVSILLTVSSGWKGAAQGPGQLTGRWSLVPRGSEPAVSDLTCLGLTGRPDPAVSLQELIYRRTGAKDTAMLDKGTSETALVALVEHRQEPKPPAIRAVDGLATTVLSRR